MIFHETYNNYIVRTVETYMEESLLPKYPDVRVFYEYLCLRTWVCLSVCIRDELFSEQPRENNACLSDPYYL